jgi:hypothetical protein
MRTRRVVALVTLGQAIARFVASWRGVKGSPWSLYGLVHPSDEPWHLPEDLFKLAYRIPIIPARIYFRIGDRLLFQAWLYQRKLQYALQDKLDPEGEGWAAYVAKMEARDAVAIRARVNADLELADRLGLAPDGGTFVPSPAEPDDVRNPAVERAS